MSINLGLLRTELREHLGVDSGELSDSSADLLLNRTYWELMAKFHFRETESSTTMTTTQGMREYPVPVDLDSLRISAIVDPLSGQHTQLERMTIKQYESDYSQDTEEQGFPTKYFRADGSIVLWPTPDDTYTIVLHYRTRLNDLADSGDIPNFPQDWHEIILKGAVWRGYTRFGDYQRSPKAKSDYYDAIATAVPTESKEEFDSSTAGVSVLGRDY